MKKSKLSIIVGVAALFGSGCVEKKVFKGDIVKRELKILNFKLKLPIPRFTFGDYNNDGKYDYVAKIYFVDRNGDKESDLIIGRLWEYGKNTLNAVAIDKNFDGYIDLVKIDKENKNGERIADGIFEEKIDASNYGKESREINNIEKFLEDFFK